MFHAPDIPTLRLCSLLESIAYAAIFVVLWARRRGEPYLLHWGVSSACYAASLIIFQAFASSASPIVAACDYGLVAISDFLLLTGMRRFDGRPGFRPWMALPIAGTIIAAATPLAVIARPAEALTLSQILGSVMLGTCMVLCASSILRGGGRDAAFPRRIVGAALFAYVPGYLISIGVQIWGPFGNSVLALLPTLQDQVLLSILNLGLLAAPWERALRRLKDSALRDSLTGAWNRAALKRRDVELASPASSLFLIDIDHFKVINDTFGHAAGDAVLVAFADRVQALANAHDGLFVRLGGDEFVLVAPTAGDDAARTLADRVHAVPAATADELPPYSISVGVSRVIAGEATLSQAMARADRSLYRAKASGRDQVAA